MFSFHPAFSLASGVQLSARLFHFFLHIPSQAKSSSVVLIPPPAFFENNILGILFQSSYVINFDFDFDFVFILAIHCPSSTFHSLDTWVLSPAFTVSSRLRCSESLHSSSKTPDLNEMLSLFLLPENHKTRHYTIPWNKLVRDDHEHINSCYALQSSA